MSECDDLDFDDDLFFFDWDPPATTGGNRHGRFPWFEVLLVIFVLAAAIVVNL